MAGRLLRLFWELFKIALFVIGGGYAIIAVADRVFARLGWTKDGELVDQLPVFQMVPGLIATHTAVYVGNKVAGAWGAALGVVAVALPSVIIFTFVAEGYQALPLDNAWLVSAFVGLRSALTGVIAATVIRAASRSFGSGLAVVIAAVAMAALVLGLPVAAVLVAAMGIGLAAEGLGRPAAGGRLNSSLLPTLLFLKFGFLCFGGGFVLVPMFLEDFVGPEAPYLRISDAEFSNLMALTQMTPGPIGVNGATFFGCRLAGVMGAVLASACLLLPGSVIAYCAFRALDRFQASRVVRGILTGARPASVALMAVALWRFSGMCCWSVGSSAHVSWCTLTAWNLNPVGILLVVFSALAAARRWVSPVALVPISAAISLVLRA